MADPTTNATSSSAVTSPAADLEKSIEAWGAAQREADQMRSHLMQLLAQMEELLKSGNTEAAFQQAQMAVMPAAVEASGESPMKRVATSMNVVSSVGAYSANIQGSWQPNAKFDLAGATKFVNSVKEIYTKLQNELKLPEKDQWMDKTQAQNILKALDGMAKELGMNSPTDSSFNANNVLTKVQALVVDAANGQKVFQNVDRYVSMFGNAISSLSQTLGADLQFSQNNFGQMMAALMQINKSTQEFNRTMVQAQKTG